MNASYADEMCEFVPNLTEAVYKMDERCFEAESLPAESEFVRVVATILVFVAWIYLIVKAYLDYEANRAELLEIELINEVEGDHRQGLHELFNNANDIDPDPANGPAVGHGQQVAATATSSSTAARDSVAPMTTRQPTSSPMRRRHQRSSDIRNTDTLAALDLDDVLSPAAAIDSARAVEPVQGAVDVDSSGKPKNPLRNVRKYARVLKLEDSRSKEPETSDEDLVPSREFKTERQEPTDACQTKTTAVVIATQTGTQQVANSTQTAADDCDTDTQPTPDVPAVQPEPVEDCQVIPTNLPQTLANEEEPSHGSNEETHCLKRVAVFNRHGTTFNEDLIAEAAARTERNALAASKFNDSKTREVTQPTSHRIIDCLNSVLLDQLAKDLARRMEAQHSSDERLHQELEIQARACYEAQRCYAAVVDQVRWFGLGWESARRETQQQQQQGHQPNRETTEKEAAQGQTTTDSLIRPTDALP